MSVCSRYACESVFEGGMLEIHSNASLGKSSRSIELQPFLSLKAAAEAFTAALTKECAALIRVSIHRDSRKHFT